MPDTHNFIRLATIAAATACSLAAQGTFTGLGTTGTFPTGMSQDGSIVVGVRSPFGPAFRWTAAEGAVSIGGDGANAVISKDGRVIVSSAKDAQGIISAAIWTGGTSWRTLGGVPNGLAVDGTLSSAFDVSADGSIIVGLAWVPPASGRAFRWDAQRGMVNLGSLQARGSRASVISGDGRVIGGWDANLGDGGSLGEFNYWRGSIWWDGLERLMNPFGYIGAVEGMNSNGAVIVGRGCPQAPRHAYRFTISDGHVEDLGSIQRWIVDGPTKDEEDQSGARAVSEDGNVVVGVSGYGKPNFPTDGFIWTPETKMVKIQDYFASNGVVVPAGWLLVNVGMVSADGKIFAGDAVNAQGAPEGWVARLP